MFVFFKKLTLNHLYIYIIKPQKFWFNPKITQNYDRLILRTCLIIFA